MGYKLDWTVETNDGLPPTPHSKFKASCTVNASTYTATDANTKKDARILVACLALEGEFNIVVDPEPCLFKTKTEDKFQRKSDTVKKLQFSESDLLSKSPVTILFESAQKMGYKLDWTVETNDGLPATPHSKFKATCTLNGSNFTATDANTKKDARILVACLALEKEFNILVDPVPCLFKQKALQRGIKRTGTAEEANQITGSTFSTEVAQATGVDPLNLSIQMSEPSQMAEERKSHQTMELTKLDEGGTENIPMILEEPDPEKNCTKILPKIVEKSKNIEKSDDQTE